MNWLARPLKPIVVHPCLSKAPLELEEQGNFGDSISAIKIVMWTQKSHWKASIRGEETNVKILVSSRPLKSTKTAMKRGSLHVD